MPTFKIRGSLFGHPISETMCGACDARRMGDDGMPPSRTLLKLCQVRDLIRACLEQPLTLEDLSLEADLSAWHFLRAFRSAFGETPHDFLTRMRVERAKDLLTISTRPVTEICFDVGFTSLGSFSTLFRREVGLSPAEFRRQVRGWISVPGRFPWAFVPICFCQHFGPAPARPA
jgi:transcriptional regulator GlxA family with amidase domain